jgi:hypothetical protein
MTQLFAAMMSPAAETVADAASNRVTPQQRASLPVQDPPIDPSMATTAAMVVVSASVAPEAETAPLKMPASQDGEATTQERMVAGIADSGIGSSTEPKSALASILNRQVNIAKMFAISDTEPRDWEWHEAMDAVSPVEGEAAKVSDNAPISSHAGAMPSPNADGMTELLHALDGSANFVEAPKVEVLPEAPGEFTPIVRATQPGEEHLRGEPQRAAPSSLVSKYVPMLLLAIAALLVANLVAMLIKH